MTFSVADQRVVVVGAGRSGRAAAALLRARGARVTLTDSRALGADEREALEAAGVAVSAGTHDPAVFAAADLVVVSPGVPVTQPDVVRARTRGVPVIGEVELAFRWLKGRVIAITGTKGKSTTTTLVARMLTAGGLKATAGGNLGVALTSLVDDSTPESIHVVEVSSFQLETIDTFRAWIAVLVNFSPDHLDRHGSIGEYGAAKAAVFRNQSAEDWAVVNADDPAALELARHARARRFDYGLDRAPVPGIGIDAGAIVERRAEGRAEVLLPTDAVQLPGRHLLSDALAATAVARLAGVTPGAIERAVREFNGLEHALERVGAFGGVTFVNDSKATNVIAARRAIESFERGVVPILGGRYKGGAFEDLRQALAARAAGAVLIGEAADLIEKAIGDVVPVRRAASIDDAVRQAFAVAPAGGAVVLAPACSSFDMFSDYAARGRAFKAAVAALEVEMRARAPM